MSLKTSLEQLEEIAKNRDEVSYGFIKQVLIIASSLFAIIVSLHKTSEQAILSEKITFTSSILLLSIGIVALAIALYSQVATHKEMFMKWKAEVLKLINDPNYKPKAIFGEPSKFYRYSEYVGYTALILSVVSLATYAILIA